MIQSLKLRHDGPEPVSSAPATHPLVEREHVLKIEQIPVEQPRLEPNSRIVYHTDPHGLAADRYRLLRMRLRELWKSGKLKKLLITSPLPEDGKSTVSVNLAAALAEREHHTVLLLEADVYRAPLVTTLGLKPGPGLAESLENGLDPLSVVRHIGTLGCYFLPAGKPSGNAGELLHGEAFTRLMQSLSVCFDWIIIDSPPIALFSDALALATHADASLLVARAGRTPSDAVTAAVAALGSNNLLGIILNGVEGLDRRYSKYYSHYKTGYAACRE
jgi:capsular exopolysaccharide synthesis family protein